MDFISSSQPRNGHIIIIMMMMMMIIIIIMYTYHALVNSLNAHMIHINLQMIFCAHVEHSPTKTPHTKHHTDIFSNGHWIVSLHVAGQFA